MCLSLFHYACVLILLCVCPYAIMYVSLSYYACVLKLLCVCPYSFVHSSYSQPAKTSLRQRRKRKSAGPKIPARPHVHKERRKSLLRLGRVWNLRLSRTRLLLPQATKKLHLRKRGRRVPRVPAAISHRGKDSENMRRDRLLVFYIVIE